MAIVTIKQLLEAGVHFGHRTRDWHPEMDPYIFTSRNNIHIIDLEKTVKKIKETYAFVRDKVAAGGDVLFVCTKRQGGDIITEEALRCGMFYVNYRWWGGMLTNFSTISKSIDRLKELDRMEEDGIVDNLSKKEQSRLMKERNRFERGLAGIKEMNRLPDVVFVVDVDLEEIAVAESNKLNIPVVALVDTNCSPRGLDYIIPGNDDAIRSIKLITTIIADAAAEGVTLRKQEEEPAEAPAPESDREESEAKEDSTVRDQKKQPSAVDEPEEKEQASGKKEPRPAESGDEKEEKTEKEKIKEVAKGQEDE